ncbi:MAG: hypothetical protein KBD01_09335 [Acidobacteria bacterium]|nr:hypothetical protein [Acidobacteriota bacterium]
MRNRTLPAPWFFVALLALASSAAAQEPAVPAPEQPPAVEPAPPPAARRSVPGQVAVFSTVRVGPDEQMDGDLVCIGCTAEIEGVTTRDVVVVGGTLRLTGSVGRELTAVFSNVTLAREASIGRELTAVMGPLDDQGASVGGAKTYIAPFWVPSLGSGPFHVIAALVGWIIALQTVFGFAVLVVVTLAATDRVRAMGAEVPSRYFLALLVGFLAHIAIVPILILLAISVIGIPFLILADMLFKLLRICGRAALFECLGRRMGRGLGREMSILGAVMLGFLPYAVLSVLPFLFGLPGMFVGLGFLLLVKIVVDWPAIGMVLLTRCGSPRQERSAPAALPPIDPAGAPVGAP